MLSRKKKLQIIGALVTLLSCATIVGCHGFFVNPTLTSVVISPASPQVEINSQTTLELFGNYNDGSTGQVTSGVSWSSSEPTVASVGSTSGVMTGVSLGTATITASAQAVSTTATATVFLTGISSISVTPSTASVSISLATTASFTATATANGSSVDITTNGATWTLTPTSTTVTCTPSGTEEVCSAASGSTTGSYTLTVGYPGTTVTGKATLNVTP